MALVLLGILDAGRLPLTDSHCVVTDDHWVGAEATARPWCYGTDGGDARCRRGPVSVFITL